MISLLLATVVAFAQSPYEPGEVLVKFRGGMTRNRLEMNQIYDLVGTRKIERISKDVFGGSLERLQLIEGQNVEEAIKELKKNKLVEFAEPNAIVYSLPIDSRVEGIEPDPCVHEGGSVEEAFPPGCKESTKTPNDQNSWGFFNGFQNNNNPNCWLNCNSEASRKPQVEPEPMDPAVSPDPDLNQLYGIEKIQADEAWKTHVGSKSFIVAVIDTGIDYNHMDLSFNLWRNPNPTHGDIVGYNFVHNDGLPYDDQGHGSHVGGTVGAVGMNGVAISGVSQRVSIMSLKFLDSKGRGNIGNAIKAIDYAIAHGARVLSNSWGGPASPHNSALYQAIERAKAADALFIAAAGNGARDGLGDDNDSSPERAFPAAFDNHNLIAVAALNDKDELARFSNYGKRTTQVAAPGVDVYSTVPGNKYRKASGTSMACPHVAGAAALIWSYKQDLNYTQIKEILMTTVDALPGLEAKITSGGRINVARALAKVVEMGGGTPSLFNQNGWPFPWPKP